MQNQSEKDDERSGLRLFGYLAGVIGIAAGIWGIADAINSISKDEYNVSDADKVIHSNDELRSMYLWTLIFFVIPFLLSSVALIHGVHKGEPLFLWPFIVLICVQAVLALMALMDDYRLCTILIALLRAGICLTAAFFVYRLRKKMIEDGQETDYLTT